MTTTEYAAIQATFPWTQALQHTRVGGLVAMIDKNGNEVPIFTMTAFLSVITNRLAVQQPATNTEENKEEV